MTNAKEAAIGNSFVIEVKSLENYTWQGTITWVEGQKKENFRSALEMLRLIDSTIEKKD
ncbi:MAG: hypothetical protein IKY04_02535 [Lachnospiraceae bacterium]|nr:hypothetical protein [Lachnospiraceae bacterium]MBR5945138.1 hypothetical protein [Lachnospiraceae bacterium]